MKSRSKYILALTGALAATATILFTPGCVFGPRDTAAKPAKIKRITYHGWTNSLRLTSDRAEVIVVPAIGRVMSFRLLGGDNVFWEDRSLDGKQGDPNGKEWINFGGDKTWPAPEADWAKYTGREQWMPPSVFDALPWDARVEGSEVVLTSPVDVSYGVRTVRRVRLNLSTLEISTTYERVSGEPSKLSVWIITQFKDPVAVYVPIKQPSVFADGYFKFSGESWPQLQSKGSYLEITRDHKTAHKMGSDSDRLIWMGPKEICVVSSPRVPGAEYPDRGASAEVYTNPDPKKYVELEMLGPLVLMKPDDGISRTNTYTLIKRSGGEPEAELRALDVPIR